MALILVRDEYLLHLYRCGACARIFRAQVGDTRISCAVNHSPGSCCHYGEREITEKQFQAICKRLEVK